MSTRTNIVVKIGETRVYIYRHHDGYLAETGADILTKAIAATGTPNAHRSPEGAADHFLRAIFAEHHDQQSYEKSPRPVYEVTSELHGDIEHVYYVDFAHRFTTGPCSIRHAARPKNWHDESVEVDDWATNAKRYSLADFAKAVNADRKACNARLAELRASSKAYADCEDYPMIEATA